MREKSTKKTGAEYFRSDLACESLSPAAETEERTEMEGAVTVLRRREADGGRSVTVICGGITAWGDEARSRMADILVRELWRMTEAMTGRRVDGNLRVLVVGLGNAHMTPDAVGPDTVRRLTVTRHLREHDEALFGALGCCELSALVPGVLGQTGMESGELSKAAVELVSPDLVIAVDALAARSCQRLGTTVQLSDGGIAPGAGIGNRRMALTRDTLGCPVLSIGVPTVVDSSTLVWDALEKAGMVGGDDDKQPPSELVDVLEQGRSFLVSPKNSDDVVETYCRLLALSLNRAFGVE